MTARKTVVCIAAHGNTLAKMQKYCFNQNFIANRDKFDLCVVFNGADVESLDFVKKLGPEYLFVKGNFGLDQSAFDLAVSRTPDYEYYLLMHYDHWFHDSDWFDCLSNALIRGNVDVLGNLVIPSNLHLPSQYHWVAAAFGLETLVPERFNCFLQGGAGLYRHGAVEALKRRGGIRYGRSNNRVIAVVCERMQSFILLEEGCRLGQIEPGYELYLKHADWNSSNIS
jgi:hypothetical protein